MFRRTVGHVRKERATKQIALEEQTHDLDMRRGRDRAMCVSDPLQWDECASAGYEITAKSLYTHHDSASLECAMLHSVMAPPSVIKRKSSFLQLRGPVALSKVSE